jgi:tungstate transport system permease protein
MPDWLANLAPIVVLSLQVSGTAVALGAILGIPLGAWLGLAHFPGRRFATAVIYSGMAMPSVVVGLLVYLLLSRSGPLGALGWLFTPQAMILAQTLLALPFIVGITTSAVAAVPAELAFQLRTLGASPWQARWAMLREARPGVVLAVATAFSKSLAEVGAVKLVGGNIQDHTRVLTTAILLETEAGRFAFALALGAALLLLALVVNLLIIRFQGRPTS